MTIGVGALRIAVPAVITYAARFASTWWLVSHEETARFDPHTFGLLGDAVLLSALALPLAGLLWWSLRRRGAWRGLFAPASSTAWTIVSVASLLLLGAPTPNQIWAVILLPTADAWPAVLSAVCWFAMVALLRAVAVTGLPSATP